MRRGGNETCVRKLARDFSVSDVDVGVGCLGPEQVSLILEILRNPEAALHHMDSTTLRLIAQMVDDELLERMNYPYS